MFVLKLAQFPREKWLFEAEIVPVLSFCNETKTGTPPQKKHFFLLVMATQLREFVIYSQREVRDNVKTVHFSIDRIILGHLVEK